MTPPGIADRSRFHSEHQLTEPPNGCVLDSQQHSPACAEIGNLNSIRSDLTRTVKRSRAARTIRPRLSHLIEHRVFNEGDRINFRDVPCCVTNDSPELDKRLLLDLSELTLPPDQLDVLRALSPEGSKGAKFYFVPDKENPTHLLMSVSFFKLVALWYTEGFPENFVWTSELHAYDDQDLVVVRLSGQVLPEAIPLRAIRDQFSEDVNWDFSKGECGCWPKHERLDSQLTRRRNPTPVSSEGLIGTCNETFSHALNDIPGLAPTLPQLVPDHVTNLMTEPGGKRQKMGTGADLVIDAGQGNGMTTDSIAAIGNGFLQDTGFLNHDFPMLATLEEGSQHSDSILSPNQRQQQQRQDGIATGSGETQNEATKKSPPLVFDAGTFLQKLKSPEFLERAKVLSMDTAAPHPAEAPPRDSSLSARNELKRAKKKATMSLEEMEKVLTRTSPAAPTASKDVKEKQQAALQGLETKLEASAEFSERLHSRFLEISNTIAGHEYAQVKGILKKLVLVVLDDRKFLGRFAAEALTKVCDARPEFQAKLREQAGVRLGLKELKRQWSGRKRENLKAGDVLMLRLGVR